MTCSTDPFPSIDELSPGWTAQHSPADAAAEGYAEGVRRGYEDGVRMAEEAARQDLAFALTALHGAIDQLDRHDRAGLADLTADAVDLALAIAEAVVGREIDAAIDPGRDALVRALQLAPDRGRLLARLNPVDLDRLGDVRAHLAGRDIELVADPAVERGGCLLQAGPARIDAQISSALARVRAELGTNWADPTGITS